MVACNMGIGLTLELIPPHSPKSPLFILNQTLEERIQMLMQQSHAHVQQLSDKHSLTRHPNGSEYPLQQGTIPTPVIQRLPQSTMVVKVNIGTFNNEAYKSYLLVMDTSSGLIWTQCEDCRKPGGRCYPQKGDYFPNSESKSYTPFNPPSPYTMQYGGGTKTSGFLAKETFTFPSTSSSSPHLKLPNIVFGCGTNNDSPNAKDRRYQIEGVFGMSMDRNSFINQIKTQSGGKFSYCHVQNGEKNSPPSYLRFGTDIKLPPTSKTIKLSINRDSYFVDLLDLGVNGERLHIDQRIIYSPDIKYKGLLLDSGGVTYYFEGGAQLDVIPEGSFQQVNYKFIYNIEDKTLQFGKENCAKNG
ncbi:unnamed protein product [Lupinus luteus]|uniref:Peptidase A1 domain-containing protein n=1 Tax=Lupinus luteus TaxID=3873 RepID=A0AAV1Y6Q1_LUPLU